MVSRHLSVRFFLTILFIGLLFPLTVLAGKKKPPAQPININTANSEELQLVPGIGPVTAGKILQMRKSYGAFKSVDDLLPIRGFGEKRLDKMRKYLTVGKPAAPVKTGSANASAAKKTAASPPAKKTSPPPASPDPDEPEEPPSR